MNMNPACTCMACGEGGHRPTKCPALHAPLKDGFWSGGNGGGGHSHDDDEEERAALKHRVAVPPVRAARGLPPLVA